MDIKLKRIDTVFLRVQNLEKSVKWYTDVLGLKLRWENLTNRYAAFDVGETALTLYETPGTAIIPNNDHLFNFFVEDIEHTHALLMESGVDIGPLEDGGGGLKWCFFKDIDGNRLDLCSF